MLIKLKLTPGQLEVLHRVLFDPSNRYKYPGEDPRNDLCLVSLESAKCSNESAKTPIPAHYSVTLGVAESYQNFGHDGNYTDPIKTPLARLSSVLQAIGLFPDKDGQPAV